MSRSSQLPDGHLPRRPQRVCEDFDAHLDRFCSSGAQILNLLVEEPSSGPSIGHIAERNAAEAAAMIAANEESLAIIAASAGFADQAHMSRAIRALTGAPPGYWRRSNRFKTIDTPVRPNPGHDTLK